MAVPFVGQQMPMFRNDALRSHVIRRGNLHPRQARTYARLGIVLFCAFVATVALLWTGALATLLTWGDRGRLSIVDLVAFLMVAILLLAIGVAYLLFTMRTSFRRIEVDLRSADRRVETEVARMRNQVTGAIGRIDEGRAAERAHAARTQQEMVRRVHAEAMEAIAATRRVAARTVREACATEKYAMKRDLQAAFLGREDLVPLQDALANQQRKVDAVHAQVSMLEETVEGRTRDAVTQFARDAQELHAGLIRIRAELLRTIEREVDEALAHRVVDTPQPNTPRGRLRSR